MKPTCPKNWTVVCERHKSGEYRYFIQVKFAGEWCYLINAYGTPINYKGETYAIERACTEARLRKEKRVKSVYALAI
jgi:hypothetical protein